MIAVWQVFVKYLCTNRVGNRAYQRKINGKVSWGNGNYVLYCLPHQLQYNICCLMKQLSGTFILVFCFGVCVVFMYTF